MLDQGRKKVAITDQNHEAIFTLNTQTDPSSLQIQCRQLSGSRQWWGSFKLCDLQPHYQAIFDRINSLYHYISEKPEEVEIGDRCVNVMLNFLKQSKVIRLELSEMVRCSADAQRKIQDRVKLLEAQNRALNNTAKTEGNSSNGGFMREQKLTLPLLMEAVNFDSYRVTNFRQIAPNPNNYLRTLFRVHPALVLPQTGIHSFQIITTSFLKSNFDKPAPQIEIGIKNDHSQAVVLALSSLSREQQCDGQGKEEVECMLHPYDHIKVVLNMDMRKLAICRNFNESSHVFLSWEALKGNKLWLTLRLYMVSIKTDLFVEQKQLQWVQSGQQ